MNIMRKAGATVALTGSLLLAGGALAGPAVAAPSNDQDGLVNLFIGEVNILNDADIGVVAQVAANVCGVKVGPVAVLGTAVDRSGSTETVCTTNQGPVTIRQN